jgi:hypothetical protein
VASLYTHTYAHASPLRGPLQRRRPRLLTGLLAALADQLLCSWQHETSSSRRRCGHASRPASGEPPTKLAALNSRSTRFDARYWVPIGAQQVGGPASCRSTSAAASIGSATSTTAWRPPPPGRIVLVARGPWTVRGRPPELGDEGDDQRDRNPDEDHHPHRDVVSARHWKVARTGVLFSRDSPCERTVVVAPRAVGEFRLTVQR